MNATGEALLQLAVVLAASKVAAEIGERVRLPAVAAEIVTGILIGPAALGLVVRSPTLEVVAELGVILLLFEVGLHMDLGELAVVGKAAAAVAITGVVLPLGLGWGVAALLGSDMRTAMFLGAALTATSVGITARVFGDLRALATVEARVVLGAAVADDVLGLVILTLVGGVATAGTLVFSSVAVATTVLVPLAFLVGGGWLVTRLAPAAFSFVQGRVRSAGTPWVLAFVLALAMALAAGAAGLAPVVGAFLAGLALARTGAADEVKAGLAPVGQLLIPVFFLLIGVDVEVAALADPRVLGLAAALGAVAVLGKLAAGAAVLGVQADRLLIGIGMIPRGEVGLIFAGVGLAAGVLDPGAYAALVLVVLGTTLVSPPLLRFRLGRLRAESHREVAEPMPAGGWLKVEDGVVEIAAQPPPGALLHVSLRAARLASSATPGARLLGWIAGHDAPLSWDRRSVAELFELLRTGGVRSWRFLDVTGLLERTFPELAAALVRRRADAHDLDPAGALRWSWVERARRHIDLEGGNLKHPEWVLLAALLAESLPDGEPPVAVARRVVRRLDLGAEAEEAVALLVGERALLVAAASRPEGLSEESILQLAAHLGSPERALAVYLLTASAPGVEAWERARLSELHALVQEALTHPEVVGRGARNLVHGRRLEAVRLAGGDEELSERIAAAPRAYVLAVAAAELARHARLLEPPPGRGEVRVEVKGLGSDEYQIEVGARDRRGLLARVTGALAEAGVDVMEAGAATWGDGVALQWYRGRSASQPDGPSLVLAVQRALGRPLRSPGFPGVELRFDDHASPWHTLVEAAASDRAGLLHALTAAMAGAGVGIHSARAITIDGRAVDHFAVTDATGRKLSHQTKAALARALRHGVGRRPSRRNATESKHAGDGVEISPSYLPPQSS